MDRKQKALNETEEIESVVAVCRLLKEQSKTIATAESCTGGMIASLLTSVPGVSENFGYGFVTYSNEAKQKLIGVSAETLRQYGAVSSQTALEMANGALETSGADLAVSVTGIAGPDGGTKEKPVGLVYMGVAVRGGESFYKKLNLIGNREDVRRQTVKNVLNTVRLLLEK